MLLCAQLDHAFGDRHDVVQLDSSLGDKCILARIANNSFLCRLHHRLKLNDDIRDVQARFFLDLSNEGIPKAAIFSIHLPARELKDIWEVDLVRSPL
jgi:hypothetical protein